MDARVAVPENVESAEAMALTAGEKLSAYGRARRQRDRRRKVVRGAVGIFTLLVVWQIMSVAYDLQLILPPPLAVGRDILDTLTLNYQQRWLYGANIYEHLLASFARAVTGFTIEGELIFRILDSLPEAVIASMPFMTRFKSTCCIWTRSPTTGRKSCPRAVSTMMDWRSNSFRVSSSTS